jgi:Rrf2 family protein
MLAVCPLEVIHMFRVNKRTDYAVRVLLALAKNTNGTRKSIRDIQAEMIIPRAFLRRIVADLSAADLVRTFPGPNGGLELSRPAWTINLRHIWESIEGPLLISDCLSRPGVCPLDNTCPVNSRWEHLQTTIVSEFNAITLEQLAVEAHLLASRIPETQPLISVS